MPSAHARGAVTRCALTRGRSTSTELFTNFVNTDVFHGEAGRQRKMCR